jgi:hypothetical protein
MRITCVVSTYVQVTVGAERVTVEGAEGVHDGPAGHAGRLIALHRAVALTPLRLEHVHLEREERREKGRGEGRDRKRKK